MFTLFPGCWLRCYAPLVSAGCACVRNPFEPWWSLKATRPAGTVRRLQVHVMRTQGRAFTRLTKGTRYDDRRRVDGAAGYGGPRMIRFCGICFGPCPREPGSWCVIQDTVTALSTRRGPRLRASREIERSALLAVIPEATKGDSELALIRFSSVVMIKGILRLRVWWDSVVAHSSPKRLEWAT